MTRETLRTMVLEWLNDDATAPVFWTTAHIDAFLEEGREVLAEEVRAFRRSVLIPKQEGVQVYALQALAPDIMAPYRVWDHTQHLRLTPVTLRQLDADRQRWLSVSGNQPLCWYAVSWAQFGVYPATGEGQGVLRVDYLAWPTALRDDGDSPEEPEPDQDVSMLYAVYMGLMQERQPMRAMERFVRCTERWKDSRARNEVQRLQARQWGRNGDR